MTRDVENFTPHREDIPPSHEPGLKAKSVTGHPKYPYPQTSTMKVSSIMCMESVVLILP